MPWPPSLALRFLPSLPLSLCFSFLTFPFLNFYFIFVHFSGKLWSRLFQFLYILIIIFFGNENGPFSSMLLYHISYCIYVCISVSVYLCISSFPLIVRAYSDRSVFRSSFLSEVQIFQHRNVIVGSRDKTRYDLVGKCVFQFCTFC